MLDWDICVYIVSSCALQLHCLMNWEIMVATIIYRYQPEGALYDVLCIECYVEAAVSVLLAVVMPRSYRVRDIFIPE